MAEIRSESVRPSKRTWGDSTPLLWTICDGPQDERDLSLRLIAPVEPLDGSLLGRCFFRIVSHVCRAAPASLAAHSGCVDVVKANAHHDRQEALDDQPCLLPRLRASSDGRPRRG